MNADKPTIEGLRKVLETCYEHCMLDWSVDDPRAVKARAALSALDGYALVPKKLTDELAWKLCPNWHECKQCAATISLPGYGACTPFCREQAEEYHEAMLASAEGGRDEMREHYDFTDAKKGARDGGLVRYGQDGMPLAGGYFVRHDQAAATIATLRTRLAEARDGMNGHGKPCYYCGGLCNALSANPGQWGIPLAHPDEPGKVKWHHIGCVSERLEKYEAERTAHEATKQRLAEAEAREAGHLKLVQELTKRVLEEAKTTLAERTAREAAEAKLREAERQRQDERIEAKLWGGV